MRALSILSVFPLAAAAAGFAGSASPVSGEYVEVRSAEVYTCGCLFSGQAETAGREAILAWKISSGTVDGVSLEGVKMAAVIVGDAHLAAYPDRPRTSCVYVDSSASALQREAALGYLNAHYAGVLGRIGSVREAEISFRRDNDRLYLRIGDAAEVVVREARLPADAHPGSSAWYRPFVPLKESTLATAVSYEYTGKEHPVRWRYQEPGITGFFGVF